MKRYLAWSAVILVAAVGASLVAALPAQVSYCAICTAEEETITYTVRFTKWPLWSTRNVRTTALSALLQEKHLVSAHEHHWLRPQFQPDPMNEFGPPVFESLGYLEAPRIVNFMRNVADYADPASVANWKEIALNPTNARVLDGALRFMHVPEAGFANRTEFLTWWGDNAYALSYRVQQLTQPD